MKPKPVSAPPGASENVIVFTVGGFSFAISASAVSEIRSLEGLQIFSPGPECQCPEKVGFTMHRKGALYFVVDAARHFGLPASRPGRVMILRLAATAVLVDTADRMAAISVLHALPLAFNGDERRWYRGLAMFGDDVVPVVNHQCFLTGSELAMVRPAAMYAKGFSVV
ncbi:MAG TPA: chemotaxis protein CheW [Candidatus Saccharimonadales bacterium]|nr:chemotaxis protein CheW [Candidatus Saccharimonadales bacterium]